MTEAQILAKQLDMSRDLSRWYLSFLKEVDVNKTFSFEGKTFNSVIWEVGHMAITQSYMTLYLCDGEFEKVEWGGMFNIGSDNLKTENYPPFKEVWRFFKETHKRSITHIASLTDEQLNQPTKKPFLIPGINTVRDVIMHTIRHESTHTGHIGWLCKLHGVKTI